jgi:hypothetical protein
VLLAIPPRTCSTHLLAGEVLEVPHPAECLHRHRWRIVGDARQSGLGQPSYGSMDAAVLSEIVRAKRASHPCPAWMTQRGKGAAIDRYEIQAWARGQGEARAGRAGLAASGGFRAAGYTPGTPHPTSIPASGTCGNIRNHAVSTVTGDRGVIVPPVARQRRSSALARWPGRDHDADTINTAPPVSGGRSCSSARRSH